MLADTAHGGNRFLMTDASDTHVHQYHYGYGLTSATRVCTFRSQMCLRTESQSYFTRCHMELAQHGIGRKEGAVAPRPVAGCR